MVETLESTSQETHLHRGAARAICRRVHRSLWPPEGMSSDGTPCDMCFVTARAALAAAAPTVEQVAKVRHEHGTWVDDGGRYLRPMCTCSATITPQEGETPGRAAQRHLDEQIAALWGVDRGTARGRSSTTGEAMSSTHIPAPSAEDRNALARVLHSAGDATDEDRRVTARQWANLTAGGDETAWHARADAALAWFAARQPTPTVSAEQLAALWDEAAHMEVPEPNGFGAVRLRFNEKAAVERFAASLGVEVTP